MTTKGKKVTIYLTEEAAAIYDALPERERSRTIQDLLQTLNSDHAEQVKARIRIALSQITNEEIEKATE